MILIAFVLMGADVASAAERWTIRAGTGGEVLASVENRAGSSFGIACTQGSPRKSLSLQYETEMGALSGKEPFLVVVAAEEFRFVLDGPSGTAEIEGAEEEAQLKRLAKRLVTTSEKAFVVRLPSKSASEVFPTAGARAAIGTNGQGLLKGCPR
ncbi:hypothetical protein [Methylobacterium crusticola]|uniref:hypothetical protein n=1 Tax=Methylobacterium crusticola TaxID=1697972 RepID=UPI000FFBDBE6|nr:hypothetical protein [Methylobacterium crusticola]